MERVDGDAEDDDGDDDDDRRFFDDTASRSYDESGWARHKKPEAASTPSLHRDGCEESGSCNTSEAENRFEFIRVE